MGVIKHDPAQTRTVTILLVVLVAAVAFIVFRMKPAVAIRTGASVQGQSSESCRVTVREVSEGCSTNRNPFQRPAVFSQMKRRVGSSMIGNFRSSALPSLGDYRLSSVPIDLPKLNAMEVVPITENTTQTLKSKTNTEVPGPRFALLATIVDSKGMCGVIRTRDSETKVVEVGDVLNGFKVIKLDLGRAVLTDGKETIVARRPQS